jgi:hypothetical protein
VAGTSASSAANNVARSHNGAAGEIWLVIGVLLKCVWTIRAGTNASKPIQGLESRFDSPLGFCGGFTV